jgi:hypothetical protein
MDLQNGFENQTGSYSGLSVLNGNLQLQIDKAASTADQRLDIFMEYNNTLSLPVGPSDDKVWTVSS